MQQYFTDIDSLLKEQTVPVTYLHVCHTLSTPLDITKKLLYAYAKARGSQQVTCEYLVSGTDAGGKMTVSVVEEEGLQAARAALSSVSSVHVYSVVRTQGGERNNKAAMNKETLRFRDELRTCTKEQQLWVPSFRCIATPNYPLAIRTFSYEHNPKNTPNAPPPTNKPAPPTAPTPTEGGVCVGGAKGKAAPKAAAGMFGKQQQKNTNATPVQHTTPAQPTPSPTLQPTTQEAPAHTPANPPPAEKTDKKAAAKKQQSGLGAFFSKGAGGSAAPSAAVPSSSAQQEGEENVRGKKRDSIGGNKAPEHTHTHTAAPPQQPEEGRKRLKKTLADSDDEEMKPAVSSPPKKMPSPKKPSPKEETQPTPMEIDPTMEKLFGDNDDDDTPAPPPEVADPPTPPENSAPNGKKKRNAQEDPAVRPGKVKLLDEGNADGSVKIKSKKVVTKTYQVGGYMLVQDEEEIEERTVEKKPPPPPPTHTNDKKEPAAKKAAAKKAPANQASIMSFFGAKK